MRLENPLFKAKKSSLLDDEEAIVQLHHELMLEYGWIPLKEFRELPIPTLFNLSAMVRKKREDENKAMKSKGRMRR